MDSHLDNLNISTTTTTKSATSTITEYLMTGIQRNKIDKSKTKTYIVDDSLYDQYEATTYQSLLAIGIFVILVILAIWGSHVLMKSTRRDDRRANLAELCMLHKEN
jgi:hypothetical protein